MSVEECVVNEIDASTHIVTTTSAMRQMVKGQDQNYTGEFIDPKTQQRVHYAINIDGHGTDHCIAALRKVDLVPFLMRPKPIEALSHYLYASNSVPSYICSGAVVTLALVYPDRIVIHNCGDSMSVVYEDGVRIYTNDPHTLDREDEAERVKSNPHYMGIEASSYKFKVISPNEMVPQISKYVIYRGGRLLAPTRAIGHTNKTCHESEVHEIKIVPNKTYRIVLASDGVSDVALPDCLEDHIVLTTYSANYIVHFYVSRWLQEWNHLENGTDQGQGTGQDQSQSHTKFKYKDKDCDDVSACVMDLTPRLA